MNTGSRWKPAIPTRNASAGACQGPRSTSRWAQFEQAVAPLLAARLEDRAIPPARVIAQARPGTYMPVRQLLIETFGSPLSPLNETELQVELVKTLDVPVVLVGSSTVGAIGRTLQCLDALQGHGIRPAAVVLMGRPDPFAVEQLERYWHAGTVFCLELPSAWDVEGVTRAAREQTSVLQALHSHLLETASLTRSSTTGPEEPSAGSAPLSRPAVADILDRDQRFVWHPYTSLRDPDPPLVSRRRPGRIPLAGQRPARSSTASPRGGRSCTDTATLC